MTPGRLKIWNEAAGEWQYVAASGGSQSAQLAVNVRWDDDPVDVAVGGLDPLANTEGSPGDPGTIDGITLADGMRVLLLGQGDAIEYGIWVAHEGAWTRPEDFANGTVFSPGVTIFVHVGNRWEETVAYLIADDAATFEFTVGTDTLLLAGVVDTQLFSRQSVDGNPTSHSLPNGFQLQGAPGTIYRVDGSDLSLQAVLPAIPASITPAQIAQALLDAGLAIQGGG